MDECLSFCSSNCQGLGSGASGKRRDVMKYLKNKKLDIYFLQDTHFEPSLETIIRSEWGYDCWFNSYCSRSRGVAILFNNTFEFKVKDVMKDDSGNYIIMHVVIDLKDYIFVNIYAPNRDDPQFFINIQNILQRLNIDNIILGGDWNMLINSKQDGKNYKNINNPKAREIVNDIILQFNLIDIWRDQHHDTNQFTWHKKLNNKIIQQGRLDFFLISSTLHKNVTKTSIIPGYRSDHSFITLDLNKMPNVRSKTFWKFNDNLLKDKKYINQVHDTILRLKQQYMPPVYNLHNLKSIEHFQPCINDQLFLEVILMEIRSTTLKYSSLKKKCELNEEKQLVVEIQKLELNKADNEEMITLKSERLQTLRQNKLTGALIRARANWIENGEKPTRYFCGLENRHFTNKNIKKLIDRHGRELNTDNDIIKETQSFYESLFSSKDNSLNEIDKEKFNDLIDTKLTEEEAYSLEGDITLKELSQCLSKMKNNKSPGSDGFTAEFFKFFWKDLKYFVLNSVNESFKQNDLSSTQKEGVITCIPKGNKPREYLKNWRPICLLNVVYKLCSGCIASRIKSVLPILINDDQTGFIKNRFIGDNLRLTYDVMHHVNTRNKKGMLLLIDFEKAFDTVSWRFLRNTLELFNFKNDIIRWVELFMKNIKSCVIVNNKVSGWFEIHRGCRQGDPISPYLFILCAEILAIMIRKNDTIRGIDIGQRELKISQYADDTTLFMDGSKESFEYCVHTILEYAKFSGLNMNFDKTQVICLGSLRNKQIHYMPNIPIQWNPQTFTLLGIEFNVELKNIMDNNIRLKMAQMRNIMKNWSKRNLTPLGRITVLKTLVLPQITHLLMTLPPSQTDLISNLEKLFFKFIWKGKPDKIKRSLAYNKINDGGMNMISIEAFQQALVLTWLRRLFNENKSAWKPIILDECNSIKDIQYFGSLYCTNFRNTISNEFWNYVIKCYKSYSENFITNNSWLFEPLFYNNKTNISIKLTGCQMLKRSKVFFIHQLYDPKRKRILSKPEILAKFNCNIDFLTHKHIEKGIHKLINKTDTYDNHLTLPESIEPVTNYLFSIIKDKKGTQTIYRRILTKYSPVKIQTKWETEGHRNMNWEEIYCRINNSLNCTRLKWFQLRIVNRILTTNKSVSKFNADQSPLCSFCGLEDETMDHLFITCPKTKKFWVELNNELNSKSINKYPSNIPKSFIMLGYSPNYFTTELHYMTIVMAKLYIYRRKINSEALLIKPFIQELKNTYLSEQYNATIMQKESVCQSRWLNLQPLLTLE